MKRSEYDTGKIADSSHAVKIGKMVICEVLANLLMFHMIINGMFPRHETDRLLPKLFNSQERDDPVSGWLMAIFKMSVIPTNILTQNSAELSSMRPG